MRNRWIISFALAVLAAIAAPGQLVAREARGHDRDPRREQSEERGRISLDQAVSMAERRFNARVVRAESRQDGEHTIYVLRLLNDAGRVWTVRVNATTGQMDE